MTSEKTGAVDIQKDGAEFEVKDHETGDSKAKFYLRAAAQSLLVDPDELEKDLKEALRPPVKKDIPAPVQCCPKCMAGLVPDVTPEGIRTLNCIYDGYYWIEKTDGLHSNEERDERGAYELSPEHIKAIVKMYKKGFASDAVGRKHGISGPTVLRHVREAGFPIRGASAIRKLPDTARQRVVDEYNDGESSNNVGKKYNISSATVINWVRDAGFPVRAPGGNNRKRL